MPDGSQVAGIIAERKLFNGKDVVDIRRGKNPQGITLADVYASVTHQTLTELERMEAIIKKERIVINDLQIMYGKDGVPVIADPLDAYAGKDAGDQEVQDTVVLLQSNKIMVENILEKKSKS